MGTRGQIALVAVAAGTLGTALALLYVIDTIVHGTLYDFGLSFSTTWAYPYWLFFRAILVLIGVAMVASVAAGLRGIKSQKVEDSENFEFRLPSPREGMKCLIVFKPLEDIETADLSTPEKTEDSDAVPIEEKKPEQPPGNPIF